MQILIVDDSKAMRMLVSRCLRKADLGELEILEASNGREGLDAAAEHLPDIVLTDWNMPEMGGLELMEALREKKLNLKVGVVTSDAGGQTRSQAMDAGASFVVRKPFTPETFKKHIDAALSGRESAGTGGGEDGVDELPSCDAVAQTLNGLLPRPVRVWTGEKVSVERGDPVLAGLYGHDGEEKVLCACSLSTALGLAAAMTLVPKQHVEEGEKAGKVPEALEGNVKELFNVLGGMFGRSALLQVALPPANTSLVVRTRLKRATARLDANVEIPGYDEGWLLVGML